MRTSNPPDLLEQIAQLVVANSQSLADKITNAHFKAHPELDGRYGPIGRVRCHEDNLFHLKYLAEALRAGIPNLFAAYVDWARVMLEARKVPAGDLIDNVRFIERSVSESLDDAAMKAELHAFCVEAERLVKEAAAAEKHSECGPLATDYLQLLTVGKRNIAAQLVLDSYKSGMSIRDLYMNIFQPAQREVGRLWQNNEISVAQEHYCTAATQWIMAKLYPYLFASQRESTGRVLIAACVTGDLHELGLRMVSDILESEGWETHFLGANTPTHDLVSFVAQRNPDVVAISATMPYHVSGVRDLIQRLRSDVRTSGTKVVVGGRAFTTNEDLWRWTGADAYSLDAEDAIRVVHEISA